MSSVGTGDARPVPRRGVPPRATGGDPTAVRVHDRYLSDGALLEAASALRALSTTLLDVRTTFADDAAVDAERLTSLADDLSAWCRDPATARARVADSGTQHWLGLLRVYLRPALGPPRRGRSATSS